MNASLQSPREGARRSQRVALVLLGSVGVVGAGLLWDAWQRPSVGGSSSAPVPLSADRDYANNDFIPGVGYYHAPYHAWYPFPYNHHDPARGYFAGGLWQLAPFALSTLRSQPTPAAVTSAMAAQRQREQVERNRAGTSGFAGTRFSGGSFSSARPTPAPSPSSGSSITRGGFGGSSHSSGGGAGT